MASSFLPWEQLSNRKTFHDTSWKLFLRPLEGCRNESLPGCRVANQLHVLFILAERHVFERSINQQYFAKKSAIDFAPQLPHEILPNNVLARNFFPQASILSHNKTVLYFGHGGQNGLNEAIKFRMPMVAMPVFSDGEDTVNKLVERGACVSVPKDSDADTIYQAIVRVRDDPTYQENVDKIADLMEMERHSPLERAVWLVEYISRTKGAEHLKISSRHLNLMQYLLLDQALFVALMLLTFCYACRKIGQKLWDNWRIRFSMTDKKDV